MRTIHRNKVAVIGDLIAEGECVTLTPVVRPDEFDLRCRYGRIRVFEFEEDDPILQLKWKSVVTTFRLYGVVAFIRGQELLYLPAFKITEVATDYEDLREEALDEDTLLSLSWGRIIEEGSVAIRAMPIDT